MIQRVSFVVDGFNVYHSVKDSQRAIGSGPLKWLDLVALCRSYLHTFGREARLEKVYYFSALATHLQAQDPDVVRRHKTFIDALKARGAVVHLGQFKAKDIWCPRCQQSFRGHEEKETDVSIALKLVELAVTNACEIAALVSGDTDIAPAIATAKRIAPHMRIAVLFPFKRANAQLEQIADICLKIRSEAYLRHQLPDPITLPDGRILRKPPSW